MARIIDLVVGCKYGGISGEGGYTDTIRAYV